MNALSGFNQGTRYPQVFSDGLNYGLGPTVRQTIASFDAVPPTGVADGCITTRVKAGSFARPNGSSGGQRALSRSLDGGVFGPNPTAIVSQQCAEPGKPITGLVDFARSSSGPTGGAGTALVFVPFARDALTFAYSRPAGSPVTQLTTAQIRSAYANNDPVNNPTEVGGVPILPCGIQSSSGTYGSWRDMMAAGSGTPSAQEDLATTVCRSIPTATDDDANGRLQENFGQGLIDKGAALATFDADGAGGRPQSYWANAQVIIGFSVSNWVGQTNGVVTNQLAGVQLGTLDSLGAPTEADPGNPGKVRGRSAFYADTTYGRDVYNVLPQQRMIATGNTGMKEIFISNPGAAPLGAGAIGRGLPAGHVAVICRDGAGTDDPQDIVRLFGFASISNCGSTALTAGSRSGAF
jgi:hypothetical protein